MFCFRPDWSGRSVWERNGRLCTVQECSGLAGMDGRGVIWRGTLWKGLAGEAFNGTLWKDGEWQDRKV